MSIAALPPVIPAQAGIQVQPLRHWHTSWTPAFALSSDGEDAIQPPTAFARRDAKAAVHRLVRRREKRRLHEPQREHRGQHGQWAGSGDKPAGQAQQHHMHKSASCSPCIRPDAERAQDRRFEQPISRHQIT